MPSRKIPKDTILFVEDLQRLLSCSPHTAQRLARTIGCRIGERRLAVHSDALAAYLRGALQLIPTNPAHASTGRLAVHGEV